MKKARLLAIAAALMASLASVSAAKRPPATTTPRVTRKAPPPKPIDFKKITDEAAALLSKYIQINTTNPPGNELPAAQMLKELFLAEGIPATTWEPAPGRGVVAARLKGIGKHTKALVLLSHMDVVPARASDWQVPPFSGEIKDGDIWGRGAIDDKGPGVINAMAMIAIKRSGLLLDRDIVFIATGDEEDGGKYGAGWLVKEHPDVFKDAGYLLNEGGAVEVHEHGKKLYAVSVSEKTPLWLRLTASGEAGHSADPPDQTAVTRLVRAVNRIDDYRTPIRILDPVRTYYHAVAVLDGGPREELDLATALRDPVFARKFLSEPSQNARVRDTITPTVLSGGDKTNVIPASAYGELDCRLLPGDDAAAFVRAIEKVIGDQDVKVEVILNFPAVSSPQKTALMGAIEKLAATRDHAIVVATMLGGFTDSHYFRQTGIISYGFVPLELSSDEKSTVHGTNERISIKSLSDGIERMVGLLKIMGENGSE